MKNRVSSTHHALKPYQSHLEHKPTIVQVLCVLDGDHMLGEGGYGIRDDPTNEPGDDVGFLTKHVQR